MYQLYFPKKYLWMRLDINLTSVYRIVPIQTSSNKIALTASLATTCKTGSNFYPQIYLHIAAYLSGLIYCEKKSFNKCGYAVLIWQPYLAKYP